MKKIYEKQPKKENSLNCKLFKNNTSGYNGIYFNKYKNSWRFNWKENNKIKNCKRMITVFNNTFFSQHRLKCNDILLIGYFWIHKLKIQQIHKITNIAKLSIYNFIKNFKRLAINFFTPEDFIVGGSKVIVKIYE
ncbi:hypothetical protein C2G38_2229659 [Gigaspora rosea]|uniref:Uncharacterized protein n=1 Tax=Gigaspora rosea TaxID=44941 RepID=A0A397TZ93_9GLOM|nr:hypothetical protein C2G38_2229659 [Gigaspora rosea]